MKKLLYGLSIFGFCCINYVAAVENEYAGVVALDGLYNQEDATVLRAQNYWKEIAEKRKEAEAFIKDSVQSTVDDILDGKFNVKNTLNKFSDINEDLWPFISDETWILILKNIRSNIDLSKEGAQDFLSDLQAVVEVVCQVYEKDQVIHRLKEGFFQTPVNEELKKLFLNLFEQSKQRINNITKKCQDFREGSSDIMAAFNALDKETSFLLELLDANAEEIATACKSIEFQEQCSNFLENKEKVGKMVKAFTFKVLSENILSAELNKPTNIIKTITSCVVIFSK